MDNEPTSIFTRAFILVERSPPHLQELLRPILIRATRDARLSPFVELLVTDPFFAHLLSGKSPEPFLPPSSPKPAECPRCHGAGPIVLERPLTSGRRKCLACGHMGPAVTFFSSPPAAELLPGWCDPEHENFNPEAFERACQEQQEYDQQQAAKDGGVATVVTEAAEVEIPEALVGDVLEHARALDRAVRDARTKAEIDEFRMTLRRLLRGARFAQRLPASKRYGLGYLHDVLAFTPLLTPEMMPTFLSAVDRVLSPGALPDAVLDSVRNDLDDADFELFPTEEASGGLGLVPIEAVTAIEAARDRAGKTHRLGQWLRETAVQQVINDVLTGATHMGPRRELLQRLKALK